LKNEVIFREDVERILGERPFKKPEQPIVQAPKANDVVPTNKTEEVIPSSDKTESPAAEENETPSE